MKNLPIPAILLAAILQLLPMIRTSEVLHRISSPLLSIVFRWATVSAALMGGIDAVSGASTLINSPLAVTATNGIQLSITVGTRVYAYLPLTTAPQTANYWTATGLPSGLTLQGTSGSPSWKIAGTPTVPGVFNVGLTAKYVQSSPADRTTTETLVITVRSTATAPIITVQPLPVTVTAGSPATFTVTATGTAPLSYQWSKDSVAIPKATNQILSLATTTLADAGLYLVTVSNSAAAVASESARLTINTPVLAPTIITQPRAKGIHPGESVLFTIAATGTEPMSYQWFRENVLIPGMTSPTLLLTNVQLSAAGNYTVKVQNSATTITSLPAQLSVTSLRISTIASTPTGTKLQWAGLAGHTYTLQSRNLITPSAWTTGAQVQASTNSGNLQISLESGTGTKQQFYRLQAASVP